MEGPNSRLYIFNQLMNFFCKLTEKNLYIYDGPRTGPQGLPYKEMVKKVNETVFSCNSIWAEEPYHWPTEQQIEAMNQSLHWGEGGDGQYSLQLEFAPGFRNTGFIQCFDNTITQWANDYQHSLNTGLITMLAVIVGLVALGLAITSITYYLCKQKKQSGYQEIHNGSSNLFANSKEKHHRKLGQTSAYDLLPNTLKT